MAAHPARNIAININNINIVITGLTLRFLIVTPKVSVHVLGYYFLHL